MREIARLLSLGDKRVSLPTLPLPLSETESRGSHINRRLSVPLRTADPGCPRPCVPSSSVYPADHPKHATPKLSTKVLAMLWPQVVVIVDKSMEIGGTGVVPHATIGQARVLTVESPAHQHKVMIEAVENQSPHFVIVDELSTKEDCQAARTIAGRGVAVIATVHGESLAQLCADPERSVLIGGVSSVTLSAREADARPDKLRVVSRRYGNAVFGAAIELRGFTDWVIHSNLEAAVDAFLDFRPFSAAWRATETVEPNPKQTLNVPLWAWRHHGSTNAYRSATIVHSGLLVATS